MVVYFYQIYYMERNLTNELYKKEYPRNPVVPAHSFAVMVSWKAFSCHRRRHLRHHRRHGCYGVFLRQGQL